ncbi:TELO2-interacting protein 2 isoform X2 [Betta splendens]|uniref:TELO2-interacting protein 2 isoform X2 n=1 Tax=Betta splendens TaxID=158456 RepID=A0A6P7NNB1_BETSP|nr:TELO2-interacting protein 2 isoform X2 [Betta splendens]
MELSSSLLDLHLSSSSERSCPSVPLPPIAELLSQLQKELITSSSISETNALIGRVELLFRTADPNWLFSSAKAELQETYQSLISALIGCAALPLCQDDCNSLPATAYQSIPSRAVLVCSALRVLMGTLGHWEGSGGPGLGHTGLLLTVVPSVCIFAVTHLQDELWTNASSRAAAQSLQVELLRAGGWRDTSHLLMGDEVLGGVLDILQPQLTKASWQRCEAVKLVFVWILLQVTRPSLSPHLPRLLPPSLILSDHFRPENCILGVRCLHHIVLNTAAADLRQFNRAEVLYHALFKHLYTAEAAVIQLVLSCLLDLLLVLEKAPSSSTRLKPCRHDDVLHLVLTHMEVEQKVALRRVYASALTRYVSRMGVAVCRHLRRVERVVLGYLEVRDPPEEMCRLKMLEVLQQTTRAAWPRMECRLGALLCCLMKMLVDVSSDSELNASVRHKLIDEAVLCIKLLDVASHRKIQSLLRQVESGCCSSEVLGCLATVSVATER